MKTIVVDALIALAGTLFLVGCGTTVIGTAGRPNTPSMQANTTATNASTIPAACLAFHQQFVMLHQLVQAAKMEQHELQTQRKAAETQQALVQAHLQQCMTSTTSSHANCTSLQGQLEALRDEARFINADLHDVVLDPSETTARQASLTATQAQMAPLQKELVTCSHTPAY